VKPQKMGKKFYSTINLWMTLAFIYPLYLGVTKIFKGNLNGIYVLLFVLALIIIVSKTTNYTIKDNFLIVKNIYSGNSKIEIEKIKKVSEIKTLVSLSRLSLNRIIISYNKYDEIAISPKDLDSFLAELKKINPNILIDF
jgi:hypothetical protein